MTLSIIKEEREQIKKETELFFEAMTFGLNEIEIKGEESSLMISVTINNPKIVIGERGKTLSEIQHLLRILIKKRINQVLFIELDINNYKGKKKEMLNDVAKDIADEVIFYKKEKILPQMNPYERRIIHLALKDRKEVKTESIGEGLERRIVIKPS